MPTTSTADCVNSVRPKSVVNRTSVSSSMPRWRRSRSDRAVDARRLLAVVDEHVLVAVPIDVRIAERAAGKQLHEADAPLQQSPGQQAAAAKVGGGRLLEAIHGVHGKALTLNVGDDLNVQSGSTLEARFGSDFVARDFSAAGLDGTLRVDDNGSTPMLTGSGPHKVGVNSTSSSLLFQNSSTGNSIAGPVGLANSTDFFVSGSPSITGGSTLTLGGDLTLATGVAHREYRSQR